MEKLSKKHIYFDLIEETKLMVLDSLSGINFQTVESLDEYCDLVITQDVNFSTDNTKIIITDQMIDNAQYNYIAKSTLETEFGKKIFRRICGENSSMSEDDIISGKSYNLTDANSIGFYFDHVLSFFFEQNKLEKGMSIGQSYMNIMASVILKYGLLPVSLDLIKTNELNFLQIHFYDSNGFYKEIKKLLLNEQVVDCYRINETSTTVIGIGFFNNEGNGVHVIDVIPASVQNGFSNKVYNSICALTDFEKNNVVVKQEKKSSLSKIKSIIDFLTTKTNSLLEFDDRLAKYPDKEVINNLDEEDIAFIKRVVMEPKLTEVVTSSVSGHREDLFNDIDIAKKISNAAQEMDESLLKTILTEEEFSQVVSGKVEEDESFQRVSGKIEEDESFQRVSGKIEEDESFQRVSGKIEEDESFQRVSGKIEEDNSKFVISGDSAQDNKPWSVKKLGISQKIQDIVQRVVTDGQGTKAEIEQRVSEALTSELPAVEIGTIEKIKNALINNAAVESLEVSISSEKDTDNIFLRLENDKMKGQLARKNDQLLRMKKLLDSMKADYVARKSAEKELVNTISQGESLTSDQKLSAMNMQLEAMMKELNQREHKIEQLERINRHELRNKDHKISMLEEKISDLESRSMVANPDPELQQKVRELSHYNTQLENQLNLAEERVKNISKKYDAEIKAREQIQMTGTELNKLIDEERRRANHFESRVEELERETKSENLKTELYSQKEKIKELELSLKEAQLEAKKYEQKMKFMTSQMSELEKKLKKSASVSSGTGNSTNDKRAKILEVNLEKMTMLKNKAEEELAKKREEAHKLKQDNTLMHNKIDELEKKLSKIEKNAA